ncbi:MAG: hypothetical protein FJ123_12695 [Deltaproteobacteria bacterium]|nr:hypothetical protein [Deltaproteobacteria bacterium]
MRKRTVYLLPLLFMILLGLVLSPSPVTERMGLKGKIGGYSGIAWAQKNAEEGKGEQDSYYNQLMKQLRAKVDEWLKDLNQKIESEDITRFEVRFLEILRSVLEWVGEKIDTQIESEEKKPKKKIRGEEV